MIHLMELSVMVKKGSIDADLSEWLSGHVSSLVSRVSRLEAENATLKQQVEPLVLSAAGHGKTIVALVAKVDAHRYRIRAQGTKLTNFVERVQTMTRHIAELRRERTVKNGAEW